MQRRVMQKFLFLISIYPSFHFFLRRASQWTRRKSKIVTEADRGEYGGKQSPCLVNSLRQHFRDLLPRQARNVGGGVATNGGAVGKIRGKLSKETEGRVGGRNRAVISNDNEKRLHPPFVMRKSETDLTAIKRPYIYIYIKIAMVGQRRVSITIIGQ